MNMFERLLAWNGVEIMMMLKADNNNCESDEDDDIYYDEVCDEADNWCYWPVEGIYAFIYWTEWRSGQVSLTILGQFCTGLFGTKS